MTFAISRVSSAMGCGPFSVSLVGPNDQIEGLHPCLQKKCERSSTSFWKDRKRLGKPASDAADLVRHRFCAATNQRPCAWNWRSANSRRFVDRSVVSYGVQLRCNSPSHIDPRSVGGSRKNVTKTPFPGTPVTTGPGC